MSVRLCGVECRQLIPKCHTKLACLSSISHTKSACLPSISHTKSACLPSISHTKSVNVTGNDLWHLATTCGGKCGAARDALAAFATSCSFSAATGSRRMPCAIACDIWRLRVEEGSQARHQRTQELLTSSFLPAIFVGMTTFSQNCMELQAHCVTVETYLKKT